MFLTFLLTLLYIILLPSILSTLVQSSVSELLLSNLYNHTSLLLTLSVSMFTVVFGVGLFIWKVLFSNFPCLKCKKKPLLFEPEPWPSSLYKNANLLPGNGSSSYIELLSILVLTISKFVVRLSIVLLKLYIGSEVFEIEFNLYCSVITLSIVSFFILLPNLLSAGKAEFIIFINCSYQSAFVASFQITVCPFKFVPLLSKISSVDEMLSILRSPLAG